MSLQTEYFEEMYRSCEDPWGFRTRWYEQRKFAITMALLPLPRFRHAFEPGCSVGVLTEQLAGRCDTVTATELPFSTRGGTSSLTLPVRTTAEPVTSRIAAAIIAGVALAGGTAPSTAEAKAELRAALASARSLFRYGFELDVAGQRSHAWSASVLQSGGRPPGR